MELGSILNLPQFSELGVKKMNKKVNGYVLFQGNSNIDNKPIVVIATLKTDNSKVGDMIQTWILREDINPNEAVKSGEDYSICGDCKHRGENGKNRSCYVNVFQAPNNVYKAYKGGKYPRLQIADYPKVFKDKMVRIGSYGDPYAIPKFIWLRIKEHVKGLTGYTHLWNRLDNDLNDICMASCDTEEEREEAKKLYWRTFRVKPILDETIYKNEIRCPASNEAGFKSTCENCGLCSGNNGKGTVDITIKVHGITSKLNAFALNSAKEVI